MKKRLISALLALCLTLAMLPAATFAAPAQEPVPASGICGPDEDPDSVTWSYEDGVITIEGTGAMKDYMIILQGGSGFITQPWEPYRNNIHTVIIKNGVTAVGNGSFYGYHNVADVTLPDGMTSIGGHAFNGCYAMTEIDIPDSVSAIGQGAFANCTSLTGISIPDGVSAIENGTFSGCYVLNGVSIPDSVTSIGDNAFAFCHGLKEISIPDGVTSIGQMAFIYCESLTDVYYAGSEEQWNQIDINDINFSLFDATIHFDSTGPDDEVEDVETVPAESEVPDVTVPEEPEVPDVPTTPAETPLFTDVKPGAYYEDSVGWAVSRKITDGTGGGAFSPSNTCTRAEIITFLWRAYGEPEPFDMENPFADVKETSYYYKPMLWAHQRGLVWLYADGKANPKDECTRRDAVTFQWIAAGAPDVTNAAGFDDVPEDGFYSNAVAWAVSKGITEGTTPTTFSPDKTCTRAQIVTFLYREMGGNG